MKKKRKKEKEMEYKRYKHKLKLSVRQLGPDGTGRVVDDFGVHDICLLLVQNSKISKREPI